MCFNFGIPAANMSPNCGAPLGGAAGIEGADIEAPGTDAAGAEAFESIAGLDLSTVTAFFNLVPFLMSPNNASLPGGMTGGGPGGKSPEDPPNVMGGGGGGGGGPGIIFSVDCWLILYLYHTTI